MRIDLKRVKTDQTEKPFFLEEKLLNDLVKIVRKGIYLGIGDATETMAVIEERREG